MTFKAITNTLIGLCVVGLLILLGYDLIHTGGSQADAQAYLDQEITKWMVGTENQVGNIYYENPSVSPPLTYNVISLLQ